jgi:hypothetical protein
MKKIAALLIALFLVSSIVYAQAGPKGVHEPGTGIESNESGQGTGQGIQVQTTAQEGEANQTQEQAREKNKEMIQQGLTNALTRVKNENARQRIQQNIEKFMQKYMERMQRMEGVEIEDVDNETGAVTLRAKEEVRFFGFIKGKATKRFEMDDKGNINERAPWYSLFYSEVKSSETEE